MKTDVIVPVWSLQSRWYKNPLYINEIVGSILNEKEVWDVTELVPALLPPNMVSLGKLLHLSSSEFSSSREGEDQLDHGFCRLVAIMIVALSDPPGSSTGPSWGGSTESEGPPHTSFCPLLAHIRSHYGLP